MTWQDDETLRHHILRDRPEGVLKTPNARAARRRRIRRFNQQVAIRYAATLRRPDSCGHDVAFLDADTEARRLHVMRRLYG